ncbi:MAG: UMP kinase [Endomicrobiales bacterium]|nr:UMP kinase [Endomicrobiales bacterium]
MNYKRVLLKLSGEALSGSGNLGINTKYLQNIAAEIKNALGKNKVQIGIVVGGGNIWRGADKDLDRVKSDYMGIIATVINSLALQDILEKNGLKSHVFSAINIPKVVDLYVTEKAADYLKNNYVIILAGGTGNPFFTTDTTAALRAAELKADVLLKATQVDGVYDSDPKKNKGAKRYKHLTFNEAIQKNLKIMDTSAFSLCRENNLPIVVFNFHNSGNLLKVLSGQDIGTLVSADNR